MKDSHGMGDSHEMAINYGVDFDTKASNIYPDLNDVGSSSKQNDCSLLHSQRWSISDSISKKYLWSSIHHYLSIYLSIHLSIYLSIHLSIYPCILTSSHSPHLPILSNWILFMINKHIWALNYSIFNIKMGAIWSEGQYGRNQTRTVEGRKRRREKEEGE